MYVHSEITPRPPWVSVADLILPLSSPLITHTPVFSLIPFLLPLSSFHSSPSSTHLTTISVHKKHRPAVVAIRDLTYQQQSLRNSLDRVSDLGVRSQLKDGKAPGTNSAPQYHATLLASARLNSFLVHIRSAKHEQSTSNHHTRLSPAPYLFSIR